MDHLTELLMALLRSEITGNNLDISLFSDVTEEDWIKLYKLSKAHDLAHLTGDAAINNNLLPEGNIKEKYTNCMMIAEYRYQKLAYGLEEVKRILNGAEIPFIPLKGSVLRDLYPQPWMRTSSDIDILINKDDIDKASSVFKACGYTLSGHTTHDISFMTNADVHIELHFSLIEEGSIGKAEKILDNIWNYAEPVEGCYEYLLKDEMFYYYHLAHMAKHLDAGGGCGIRSFLDLWILNHCSKARLEERNTLILSGGLNKFCIAVNEILGHWFEGKELSPLSAQLEEFILSGGIYGTSKNRAAIGVGKKKSKIGYLLKRFWMPYNELCGKYPSLKGKRIMQPLYEVRRWGCLIKKDTFLRYKTELKESIVLSDKTKKQSAQMLSDLGLL